MSHKRLDKEFVIRSSQSRLTQPIIIYDILTPRIGLFLASIALYYISLYLGWEIYR